MGSLFSLKKYFLRYKFKLAMGIIFIMISNASQVYIPLLLKNGIDRISTNPDNTVILNYAFMIVGTAVFGGVFRFLIRQTIIVVSREIEYDLRQDFWNHLQKLPLRFFQNNSTGNLMAHATNDISAVRMFVGPAVMYSIDTFTKSLIITVIMVSIHPALTFYALIPLPFLSFLVYLISRKINKKYTLIQEKFSEITTKAQETFSGIRVIKSYVREEGEQQEFNRLSSDYYKRTMEKVRIQASFMPVLYMITGISAIIVVWTGGGYVIEGTMTIGEIAAFIVYLGLLIWPVIAFGWVANIIQQAEASMKRLNSILSEEYEITDTPESGNFTETINGSIEFRDVVFRYRDGLPDVLKKINLKIENGETLAIIGSTGSGKTSLVNLIPRLYDTTEGEVLVGGIPVRSIPLSKLREIMGIVPQDTFLFSDTITENILYGCKQRNQDKARFAASVSKLTKDIEQFPKGFDTILGERGITLSGGQKQRTCIARAIAVDPKILILDDSFSAVDTFTEEEILKELKEFMKGRTSIIISHRISTVKDADKIIVLDDGLIKESGTHSELIKLNGIYADLNFKQMLEKELEGLA